MAASPMWLPERLGLATLLLALGAVPLVGCGSSDASSAGGPRITSVQLTVSPANVLAYLLTVDTDKPTTVSVEVTPDDASVAPWTVSGPADLSADNELAVAGLRAENSYTLRITVTDAGGRTAIDDAHSITTDALPPAMPPIDVQTSDPQRMADGFTLFDVFRWLPSGGTDDSFGWLVIVDAEGQVVWYATTGSRPEDARLLPDGNIGYSYASDADDGYIELDRLSQPQRRWVATKLGNTPPAGAIPVDVDSIHHEVFPLPNGNFLTLSSELRQIGPSTCPGYTGTFNVVGDDVVEFEPETGKIVQSVSLFDILDPCRRTDHDFDGTFWNRHYGGITTKDWTHANAVVYDPVRKLALVSVRQQDWVVGLHWTPGGGTDSGKPAWLLGDEATPGDYGAYASFAPTGTPFAWQYHQHAPEVTADGNILLFDNGNLRPGTNFDPTDAQGDADLPLSRVVEFHLDDANKTVSQTWEWRGPDYCPFIGDADLLDNGDVLATFGGAVEPASDAIGDPAHRKWGRIAELARDANDDIVWDLRVRDPAATGFTSYSIYRADRITGFPR